MPLFITLEETFTDSFLRQGRAPFSLGRWNGVIPCKCLQGCPWAKEAAQVLVKKVLEGSLLLPDEEQ